MDIGGWFQTTILDTGRGELFVFFVALIVGFAFIRISVRMIRAQVRWWPGNVKPGGLHIHHVTFGIVFMLIGGIGGLAAPDAERLWSSVLAAIFGIGTALVLDEFALVLHLEDVYWTARGRQSVDAVFVAIAIVGLLLVGSRPIGVSDAGVLSTGGWVAFMIALVVELSLAAVTLVKGKIWTGLIGLFLPVLLVGAPSG